MLDADELVAGLAAGPDQLVKLGLDRRGVAILAFWIRNTIRKVIMVVPV
jgi:hypothetical protein